MCCFVKGKFLKANFLLFLNLCNLHFFIGTFQLCGLSAMESTNSRYCHVQMTRNQAQNTCDGGLHIKCDTKNKKRSRNLNSVPLPRVIKALSMICLQDRQHWAFLFALLLAIQPSSLAKNKLLEISI